MISLPFLFAWDPEANTEGTIDPLGLYSIADALALKMIPGVRKRMWRPRFLTATAVAAAVCVDFGDDAVAVDNVTPPWLVFEWHVIEGLVRGIKEKDPLTHVPGRDEVKL